MIIGVNWHSDNITFIYNSIFSDPKIEESYGRILSKILSDFGAVRYPGGKSVQSFVMDYKEAFEDLSGPGFPIFYKFCKKYNIKIIQQLPTTGFKTVSSVKAIKNSITSSIDWKAVDLIIDKTRDFLIWLKKNNYIHLVVRWEIGNEDWIDDEGKLSPHEYVEIVTRYLNALSGLVSRDDIIICGQAGRRGGSRDWGSDVVRLAKAKGLFEKVGGITSHIYPYFLNQKKYDSSEFDFEDYCLGEDLIVSFSAEYFKLDQVMNDNGIESRIKIYITEMAIDIAGPPRKSDGWLTFNNNKKNYAAAIAAVRCFFSIATSKRFGGMVYHSLTHRSLVAPEQYNPTQWKGYTSYTDWGWGQLWYLPLQRENQFILSPLLEFWAMLVKFASAGSRIAKYSDEIYLSNNATDITVFILNTGKVKFNANILADTNAYVISVDDLKGRAIKYGSYGFSSDISHITTKTISIKNGIKLSGRVVVVARAKIIYINGKLYTSDIIKSHARYRNAEISLDKVSVKYQNGKLKPYPDGVVLDNYPMEMIEIDDDVSLDEIVKKLFSLNVNEIKHWTIRG